jgi:hypothetical protein
MNYGRNLPPFRRKLFLACPERNPKRALGYFSVVNMEITCLSEVSINLYQNTLDHMPEDTNLPVSSSTRGLRFQNVDCEKFRQTLCERHADKLVN